MVLKHSSDKPRPGADWGNSPVIRPTFGTHSRVVRSCPNLPLMPAMEESVVPSRGGGRERENHCKGAREHLRIEESPLLMGAGPQGSPGALGKLHLVWAPPSYLLTYSIVVMNAHVLCTNGHLRLVLQWCSHSRGRQPHLRAPSQSSRLSWA